MQALSRRIHYGKFVAEAKFRRQTTEYTALIERSDAGAIMDLLTDRAVELKVIERVKLKAATFGQDLTSGASSVRSGDGSGNGSSGSRGGSGNDAAEGTMRYKIPPEAVAQLYEQWVMPLTKDVEVEYLLRRLEVEPQQGV